MRNIILWLILEVTFLGSLGGSSGAYLGVTQEMRCCAHVTGSCRSVCSQISLVDVGAEPAARENSSRRLLEFCSPELSLFWSCVNSTFDAAARNQSWAGRQCCQHAQYPICRSTCALAASRRDLAGTCRVSDEPEFYNCLDHKEASEKCCNSIDNDTCRSICRDLFANPSKQSTIRPWHGCNLQRPKCLNELLTTETAENPKQDLHCCREAPNPKCLDTCRRTLLTAVIMSEILDTLEQDCGNVTTNSPFWSCFMRSVPATSQRLPLDIGKMACCSRAVSSTCQDLCWRAFQSDWAVASQELDSVCLASSAEGELRTCLEEAEEPCELGCSDLSFCSNFNDRPTTLFRTCSARSDLTAKSEVIDWSRGATIHGLGFPFQIDPSCPAETLKAAVCYLQLRPCHPETHETRLCRNDCIDLLTNCVDWSQLTGAQSAISFCSRLSPPRPDMPCISLKPYINPTLPEKGKIITPCKDSPCGKYKVCTLEHNSGESLYKCLPGCYLGEMSGLLVPHGSWVQIPREDKVRCLKICQCTAKGLEKCRTLNCLPPMLSMPSCFIQNRGIADRAKFYLDCKPCHCYDGEITCSRKPCGDMRVPALPCDCPAHYVPVCGRSGVTAASSCIAKCTGLTPEDFEFGRCSSKDPCKGNPCGPGEKCIKRARVCLAPIYKPCKQYECVPIKCAYEKENIQLQRPVCDKDRREHYTVCDLIRSGGVLGYWGPCLKGCSLRGPVCGINGEVYPSECAAWAENVIVDYFGPCVAVGKAGEGCGSAVKCPEIQEGCIGVIPPGACCRICGAAARLFYSRKQLDRIYYMMTDERDKDAVTLEAMLTALGRQIQVSGCILRGSMTPEGDIFVMIQTTSTKASDLQTRACIAEMEKIVIRITEKSPKVMAEVPLGALTGAEIIDEPISSAASQKYSFIFLFFPILIIGVVT